MPDKIFLTDERRKVLEGDADHLTEESERVIKSRIRVRARMALEELTEVAQSPVIKTESVFEPDDVRRLVIALLTPDEPDVPGVELSDDWEEYQDRLDSNISRALRYSAVSREKLEQNE